MHGVGMGGGGDAGVVAVGGAEVLGLGADEQGRHV